MTNTRAILWALLGAALLLRLLSLAAYPLMDTTEARYGEMARIMVETGNWLTPQFDYNVPFWGKPPLFAWMSASSATLFGVSEFALRFPHWLAGVATLGLIAYMAKCANLSRLVSCVVLASCGIFSIGAGAVMTDMALTFSFTLAIMGFYYCWQQGVNARRWGYVGFVGLAIGLLAKGPVVLLLMALTTLPWLCIQHGVKGAFSVLWQRFALLSGSALMLLIALPWYLLAERATPGFLDYFLVGEHFKRFVISGWQGDLYGSAHHETLGTIWLFWLKAALPWSLVLPVLLWRRRAALRPTHGQNVCEQNPGLVSLLLCWLLAPLWLFSLAGNILPAYVLPGIPAIGLLMAILIKPQDNRLLIGCAAILPVVLVIALVVLNLGIADRKSDRALLSHITDEAPIFYLEHRPFSGQFYSQGRAKLLRDPAQLTSLPRFHLIGKPQALAPWLTQTSWQCQAAAHGKGKRQRYTCTAP